VVTRAALASTAALVFAAAAPAAEVLPFGRALVVTTAVSPETHLFADQVVARVDVLVDPSQLRPDRLRVDLGFDPYETIGETVLTRRDVGALVQLRFTTTLRCLNIRCLGPRFTSVLGAQEAGRAERHRFQFRPAEVRYRHPNGRGETLLRRGFPTVEVVSRLNTARLAAADEPITSPGSPRSAYVASLEPPPPTYRIAPTLLAALALTGAALLFLFPCALVGRLLYRRWRAARRPRPLSPLERALMLVEWTGRRRDGAEERRKALEALADALEGAGQRSLAERARQLAWAAESPGPERARDVAAAAREAVAKGGRHDGPR
jgi:hypothetical protein